MTGTFGSWLSDEVGVFVVMRSSVYPWCHDGFCWMMMNVCVYWGWPFGEPFFLLSWPCDWLLQWYIVVKGMLLLLVVWFFLFLRGLILVSFIIIAIIGVDKC